MASLPPGATPAEPTPIKPNLTAVDEHPPVAVFPSLRMGKRVVTIDLGDVDGYEGMSFRAWVNYPPEVRNKFQATTEDERIGALQQIVISTNFVDDDGNPFLDSTTREFWKAIPDDLAVVMIQRIVNAVGKLDPKIAGK